MNIARRLAAAYDRLLAQYDRRLMLTTPMKANRCRDQDEPRAIVQRSHRR
jgi:hypothetical protein